MLAAFDREVEALSEDEQVIEIVEPLGGLCALIERITRAACRLRGAVFNEPCEEEALDEEVEVAARILATCVCLWNRSWPGTGTSAR